MAGFEDFVYEGNRAEREQMQNDKAWREAIAHRVSEMAQYLLRQEVAPLPIFVLKGSEWQTTTIKTGLIRREKKNLRIYDFDRLPQDGWLVKPYAYDDTNYANILTTDGLVLNAKEPGIATSVEEHRPKITVVPAISCTRTEVEDFFLPGMINSLEPGGFSDRIRILANDGDQFTYMQRPEWRGY